MTLGLQERSPQQGPLPTPRLNGAIDAMLAGYAMSNEAVGWVFRHSPYSGAQLVIHLSIADVVNDAHGHEFWMSTEALAKKSKCARSTVTATLSDMVARGLLIVVEAGGATRRPTRYRFLTSAISDITSAIRASSLDRSSVTNYKGYQEEQNRTSAISGLVPSDDPPAPPPWRGTGKRPMDFLVDPDAPSDIGLSR